MVFTVLAIGVDDGFVLAHSANEALDAAAGGDSTEDVMTAVIEDAGVAITMTSFTDAAALLVGYFMNDIVLYRSLCLFGAVGVLLDFMFQITFFMAYLSIEVSRQLAQRKDLCVRCCCSCSCCPTCPAIKQHPVSALFGDILPSFMWRRSGLAFTMLLAIVAFLIGMGTYGLCRVETASRPPNLMQLNLSLCVQLDPAFTCLYPSP